MSIGVGEDETLLASSSRCERLECGGRRKPLERRVATLQPAPVEVREPRAGKGVRAPVQKALRDAAKAPVSRDAASLEVALQLADRRGLQRRFQLLPDYCLVGLVGPVDGSRKHQPEGPRGR